MASIDPDNGEIVRLYRPNRDRRTEHFQLNAGEVWPLTEIGK